MHTHTHACIYCTHAHKNMPIFSDTYTHTLINLNRLVLRTCNGYVTTAVLQALSEVSDTVHSHHREIASTGSRTRHLWLPKRHHYQLCQRKASYSMMRVAHYIPEE